jgi:hypothetical protein
MIQVWSGQQFRCSAKWSIDGRGIRLTGFSLLLYETEKWIQTVLMIQVWSGQQFRCSAKRSMDGRGIRQSGFSLPLMERKSLNHSCAAWD